MAFVRGASRRLRRTAIVGAAACLSVLLPVPALAGTAGPATGPTATPPASSATAATANVLMVWAPQYMERGPAPGVLPPPPTQSEAVEQAKKFDVIIAKPFTYQGLVGAMRTANPRLKLYAYINGTFAASTDGSAYPPDWYVYDASGAQVRSTMFYNYMMDPANPGWVDNRRRLCASVIASSGYDGCGLDVLGSTPVTNNDFVTGTPINARTGLRWTAKDWLTATTALAAAARSYTSPHPLAGNGISDGGNYFSSTAPTSQLYNGLDLGMAEGFLRNGRAPLSSYPGLTSWKQNVNMLADVSARGRQLVVTTKVWNTGTQAQKDAWHKFALASFLLGNSGGARFCFLYDISDDPSTFHPWWATQLGAPSGRYVARSDGTYARDFASGRVLVNPGTGTRTISLGGTFTTLDGRRVTSVVLGPHSGEVLTK